MHNRFSNVLVYEMNVLILDNDECLGSFGFISGMYENLIGQHFLMRKLNEFDKERRVEEKLFINFAIECLNAGFGRPGLKEFFRMIKDFKEKQLIHCVIMYTSAARNNSPEEKPYLNWVGTLRKIFETSVSHYKPHAMLYDYDHSGRSDENPPRMSEDGATQKSVDVVLERLGIKPERVRSVIFIDDRPQNIWKWDEKKLVRLGVEAYYYLPEKAVLQKICSKYDPLFEKCGLLTPSRFLDDAYNEEVEDMRSENKTIGGPPQDNDYLSEEQIKELAEALFEPDEDT